MEVKIRCGFSVSMRTPRLDRVTSLLAPHADGLVLGEMAIGVIVWEHHTPLPVTSKVRDDPPFILRFMSIRERLQENCNRLLESYQANIRDVQKLQETLLNDILPSVTDELQLSPDATEWSREWLMDTGMLNMTSQDQSIEVS